jgi:hypothetical protein
VHHAIPHQIGPRGIRNGVKAVKRFLRMEVARLLRLHRRPVRQHHHHQPLLAMHELMLGERLLAGHNLLLISGASGIVITHATLTVDDLPDATGRRRGRCRTDGRRAARSARRRPRNAMRRCRIESLAVSPPRKTFFKWGSLKHAVCGGTPVPGAVHLQPERRGVLINSGVHRDGHVCEPAIAAYVQHRLGINVEFQGRRTLSFDLLNGGCGMLNAAQVVCALVESGEPQVGMVVSSEANADADPDPSYPFPTSGAAACSTPRRCAASASAGSCSTPTRSTWTCSRPPSAWRCRGAS